MIHKNPFSFKLIPYSFSKNIICAFSTPLVVNLTASIIIRPLFHSTSKKRGVELSHRGSSCHDSDSRQSTCLVRSSYLMGLVFCGSSFLWASCPCRVLNYVRVEFYSVPSPSDFFIKFVTCLIFIVDISTTINTRQK